MLDALLKLRQVCCDPRLVKLDHAQTTAESSKLELLLEMLPELIAEGRRILLFSHFTSMLALIGAELDGAKIGYLTLTGETTDRTTPIKRFARGDAPVFLISLKAGGVGSISPRPTPSSTMIPGGIQPPKIRPPTARTA